MRHRKPEFEIYHYGEYSKWNRESREIPRIKHIGTEIFAEIGTEFGYVLRIKKGKGEKLTFKIEHPPFKDENGEVMPSFTGEYFIQSNDFQFFLGDCIWEPIEDKMGKWILTTYHQSKIIAQKTFNIKKKSE